MCMGCSGRSSKNKKKIKDNIDVPPPTPSIIDDADSSSIEKVLEMAGSGRPDSPGYWRNERMMLDTPPLRRRVMLLPSCSDSSSSLNSCWIHLKDKMKKF